VPEQSSYRDSLVECMLSSRYLCLHTVCRRCLELDYHNVELDVEFLHRMKLSSETSLTSMTTDHPLATYTYKNSAYLQAQPAELKASPDRQLDKLMKGDRKSIYQLSVDERRSKFVKDCSINI